MCVGCDRAEIPWDLAERNACSELREPRSANAREPRAKTSPTAVKLKNKDELRSIKTQSHVTVHSDRVSLCMSYSIYICAASCLHYSTNISHYALRTTHSLQYLHFLHYLHYLHCHSYLHYTLPPVNAYRSWRWPRTATACTHQQSMPSAFGGIVRLPLEADRFRCKLVLPAGSATEPADSIDAERLRSLVSQKPL